MNEANFKALIWNKNTIKTFNCIKQNLIQILNKDILFGNESAVATGNTKENKKFLLTINFTATCYSCSLYNQNNNKEPIAFAKKTVVLTKSADANSSEKKLQCIIWAVKNFESILIDKSFMIAFYYRNCIERFEKLAEHSSLWLEELQNFRFENVTIQQDQNQINKILVNL